MVAHNIRTADKQVSWTVPDTVSDACLMRIRNARYGGMIDTSDAPFSIVRGNAVGEAIPAVFSLAQNVPNPFNPVTSISFSLPDERRATLIVYTAAGTKAATLADGVFSAGTHEITWNASDFPSGVYLCRLRAGTFDKTVKMALVK